MKLKKSVYLLFIFAIALNSLGVYLGSYSTFREFQGVQQPNLNEGNNIQISSGLTNYPNSSHPEDITLFMDESYSVEWYLSDDSTGDPFSKNYLIDYGGYEQRLIPPCETYIACFPFDFNSSLLDSFYNVFGSIEPLYQFITITYISLSNDTVELSRDSSNCPQAKYAYNYTLKEMLLIPEIHANVDFNPITNDDPTIYRDVRNFTIYFQGEDLYRVWKDSELLTNWTVWENNVFLTFPVNTSAVGTVTYKIEFYDDEAQYSSDEIVINIIPHSPSQESISFGFLFLPIFMVLLVVKLIRLNQKRII